MVRRDFRAIKSRIGSCVKGAAAVLGVFFALNCSGSADDRDPVSLAEIRDAGFASILAVHSIEFDFEVEQSTGWNAQGRFSLEGERFRSERRDVTGLQADSNPDSYISAYNDQRSQFFTESQSRLMLKDGPGDARYTMDIPFSIVYAWLRIPGMPLRWNSLRDPATWEKRFQDARLVGHSDVDGMPVEVVSVIQSPDSKRAGEYRVSFAPSLGYLPLSYERRIDSDGELASRMRVTRWTEREIDSVMHAIPLEVTFEQTDADGASLPMSMTMRIRADTLKVNEDIDDELFTIPTSIATHVFDVDENQRALAQAAEPPHPVTPIVEKPVRSRGLMWGLVAGNVVLVLILGAFWCLKRRRSA